MSDTAMNGSIAARVAQLSARVPGRLVYPVLRTISIVLIVFVAVVSLVDDPSDVTGGGGALADWVSTVLFGTPFYGDKVAHFGAYAVLSFVTVIAFGRHRRSAASVLFGLLVFGGSLELLQAAGGVRTGDVLDLLANTLGIMAGGGAGALLRFYARRRGFSPV